MKPPARPPHPGDASAFARRALRLSALLLLACGAASAQESFRARHASARYDALVRVAQCGGAEQDHDEGVCSGPGVVSLYRKGAAEPFQTLRLPNVWFNKTSPPPEPPTAGGEAPGLYRSEYGLIFNDFNFDGREDLAVCNGRGGVYGGPSYTVLLFNRRAGRFAESRSLTRIADDDHFGLFTTDRKRRVLTVSSRSGCCHHQTSTYRVVNDRPVLVEQVTEDPAAPGAVDGATLVTTKKRVGGRWVVKRKWLRVGEVARPGRRGSVNS